MAASHEDGLPNVKADQARPASTTSVGHFATVVFAIFALAGMMSLSALTEPPLGRVTGRVYTQDLRPLPGARVSLSPIGDTEWTRSCWARTDRDGRFEINAVPAGGYALTAHSPAHGLSVPRIEVEEAIATPVALRLNRTLEPLTCSSPTRAYLPSETPYVTLAGYVEPHVQPPHVELRRLDMPDLMAEPDGLAAFRKVYDTWSPPAEIPSQLTARSALVRSFRVSTDKADVEGHFEQRIVLGGLGPGVYYVSSQYAKSRAYAVITVTDLAVVVKKVGPRAHAFVAELRSGKPVPGARVHLYNAGRLAAAGVADDTGLARLDSGTDRPPSGFGDRWSCALAERGGNYAIAFGYDAWPTSERTKVFVYTERPIYRPGQQVRFKGIVRKVSGPGPQYAVPSAMPVKVQAEDPEGVILTERIFVTGQYGSFSGSLTLSPETPSGSCTIFVAAGGATEAYDFTVASYRKPEFRLEARPRRSAYVAGETIEVEVLAEYYYGAPLAGATIRYSTSWSPLWDWEGASGDEEEYETPQWIEPPDYGMVDVSATATLDAAGRALLRLPSSVAGGPDGPQGHSLTVSIEVSDATGRSVEMSTEARVFPGSVRLFLRPDGYVLAPNKPAGFIVRATDLAGAPVAGLPVTLQIVRQQSVGSAVKSVPIGTVKGTTDRLGRAYLTYTSRFTGELKAEIRARDPHGRAVGAQTYLWCVTDRGGDLAATYGDLSLHGDKRRYVAGDVARLLINSDRIGATALLTVEGETLHEIRAVPLTSRSTIVRVPVRPEYGPRAEVNVACVYRKRLATTGMRLRVDVPTRKLSISVKPGSAECRPGTTADVAIRVTDHSGRPTRAEASIAVVDEAVYSLMEDDPDAIMDAFYPWIYTRVTTMHSCEERLYSGDKGAPTIEARRRFEDAPFWAPHVLVGADGKASVRASLPDNLTTWRVTAVAHTRNSQFGYATGNIVTTLPFHVRVDVPRFLTSNDRVRLNVAVSNRTKAARTSSVRLISDGLTIEGPAIQNVQIAPGATAVAGWFAVATRPGTAKVRADAWTNELPRQTDAVEVPVEVRPLAREVTHVFSGQALQGKPTVHRFVTPQDVTAASITLRIAPGPLAAMPDALEYLRTFPYGCVEQTVSAFYPALLVETLLKRLNANTANELKVALGAAFQPELDVAVRDGITRLRRMQQQDGAWGWFQTDPGDLWLTSYALLALTETRRSGRALPRGMVEEARNALTNLANRTDDADARAFSAFALAEVGVDFLHRLNADRMSASGLACATLAARRLGVGKSTVDRFLAPLLAKRQGDTGLAWWPGRTDARGYEWTRTNATSLAIRAVAEEAESAGIVERGVRYLMLNRFDAAWRSTRDTAFAIAALCAYARQQTSESPQAGGVRLLINGRQVWGQASARARSGETTIRLPNVAVKPGANDIVLLPTGGGTPFYSVLVRTQAEGSMNRAISSEPDVTITRTFESLQERTLPFRGAIRYFTPVGREVRAGTVLRRRLVIHTQRELPFVMVTDPLPAGVEPSARGDVDADWNQWYSATDVRDDRVVFFARRVPRGKHVLEYHVRAQSPGRTTALPARLECMYSPEVRVETSAQEITVR